MLHIGTGGAECGTNDRKIRAELKATCYPLLFVSYLILIKVDSEPVEDHKIGKCSSYYY